MFEKSVLGLTAAILSFQLFLPPVVGLANNGDFGKVIARFNLGAPFEYEFRYATTKYTFDPKYHYESGIYSSELMLVYAALGLSALVSRDGSVDIRCIGVVHSALFLLALYLLVPVLRNLTNRVRVALAALVLFVFCDVMYVALFNSFYMDTGAFLFLLLGIAFFARAGRRPSAAGSIGFVISCVLLVTTKVQHCLLGIPLAVFVLWKSGAIWPGRSIRFKAIAASAILCAAFFTWTAVPPEYDVAPLYTMIFTGILPSSKEVSQDLQALGLDDSYARYIGTNGFTLGNPLGNPVSLRQFTSRTSYPRLGYFFLTHPSKAYLVIRTAMGEAGRQKPNLGNFDKSAGKPEWAETQSFAVWSGLKKSVFYSHGVRYLLYFTLLAACAGMVAAARARKTYTAPLCLLITLALVEMGVSCLGDAAEITRHCFLFNALLDILLVATVAAALAGTPKSLVTRRLMQE